MMMIMTIMKIMTRMRIVIPPELYVGGSSNAVIESLLDQMTIGMTMMNHEDEYDEEEDDEDEHDEGQLGVNDNCARPVN